MPILRYVAKDTQRRYGIRRYPAVLSMFINNWIVRTIDTQSILIQISPAIGERAPKKRNDQRTLNINWIQNHVRAYVTDFFVNPFCHMRNAAMPIRANSNVHTGPKIQFGGLSGGFMRLRYQVGILGIVATDPMEPRSSLPIMNKRSVVKWFFFMCLVLCRIMKKEAILEINMVW